MQLLRLQTILVADDLTPVSAPALRTGAVLRDSAGAALHVAHVAAESEGIVAGGEGGKRAEFLFTLRQGAERAGLGEQYTPHVLSGSPADAIGALATQLGADVIVTGRRQWNPELSEQKAVGGTTYAIITRATAPCLSVSRPMTLPLVNTLVAIDGSPAARGALLAGLSWASALRGREGSGDTPTLTALHVHTDDERAAALQRIDAEFDLLKESAGEWASVRITRTAIRATETARTIGGWADQHRAGLVVLGTHAKADAHTGLGSVSAAVLEVASAPVLLVPPATWKRAATR